MGTNPTPNHNFPVPNLTEPGPAYATDVNTCLNEIDTALGGTVTGPGSAVVDLSQQPTTGDISADGYNLSNVRSVEFQNQSGTLVGSQDVNCLYVNQNNLGFNNNDGYFIQLTDGNTPFVTSLLTNLTFAPANITTNTIILPTATYNTLNVNTGGGAITITLPVANLITPTPQGRVFFINDIDQNFGVNNCTIQVTGGSGNLIYGGNLLIGVSSFPLNATGQNLMIYTDGSSKWYVMMFNQFNYYGQPINYAGASRINMDDTCGLNMPGYFLPNTGNTTNLVGAVSVTSYGPDTGTISVDIASGLTPTVAFAVLSNVANGIQSTATAGISTNTMGTIQSNKSTGGFVMNGGPNDWPTFTSDRSRTVCYPIQVGYSGTSAGFAMATGWGCYSSGDAITTNTVNTNLQTLLLPAPHNGSTISSVSVVFAVSDPHSGGIAGITFPKISVTCRQLGSGVSYGSPVYLSSSNTQTFPTPGSAAIWYNTNRSQLLTYTCNQNNVVDTTQYTYSLYIEDENNGSSGMTNAVAGNIYVGVQVNYTTIPNMQFP